MTHNYNYQRNEYVEAYKFDGTLESVVNISKITTVNALLRYGDVATIEVYTAPKTNLDSGYSSVARGTWVVKTKNGIELWNDRFFQSEFIGFQYE